MDADVNDQNLHTNDKGKKRWWVGGIPLTTRSFTKLAISLGSPLFSTDSDFTTYVMKRSCDNRLLRDKEINV